MKFIPALHRKNLRADTMPRVISVLGLVLTASLAAPSSSFAQRSPATSNDTTNSSPRTSPSSSPLSDDEVVEMNQFVVSSSVTPRRKMDSALSVTTLDENQVQLAQPRSAADLIQLVPGFYVEPSGGESRNNVFARGLSTGGYQYMALQEDGLPVISVSNIAFSNADLWIRMTNWISRVEAIRGGTSGIFQSNAPAGVINFIGREGSSIRAGELLLQTSDFGQFKTEAWTSGPIDPQTTYAIGLTYRRDRGIRDPGFLGDQGYWLQGNVKHTFRNGYIKVSGKYMYDRSTFYYPFPLADIQNPHTIPGGIDIRKGTGMSNDMRIFDFKGTPDGDLHFDLKDGDYVPLYYIGSELELDLPGDFKLQNRNRFTYTPHTSDQIQFSSIATPLQTFANQIGGSAAAAGQFAAAKDAQGNYHFRVSIPGEGGVIVPDASKLNGNGLADLSAQRHTFNTIHNFQDDLRLLKELPNNFSIAVGFNYAWIKADIYKQLQNWLAEVANYPRRLDLEFLDATTGAPIGYGTYNGLRQLGADYRRGTATQSTYAGYINLEKTVGNWHFDAGYRYELMYAKERVQLGKAYDMNPAGQTNPALRNALFGSGVWREIDFGHFSGNAFTAAANYTFNPHLSAYARYSDGFYFPITDQFELATIANNHYAGPTTKLHQAETGLKYSTRKFAVFATVFGGWVKDQPFTGVIVNPDGTIGSLNENRNIFSRGVELELFYTPWEPLTFHFTGTAQNAQFTSHEFVSGTDSNGKPIAVPIYHNQVVRVPKKYCTAAATYRLPKTPVGRPSIDFSWSYVGDRFTDEANKGVLKSYSVFNGSVNLVSGHVTYRVQVQNLFQSEGLTEGDPRLSQFVADPNARFFNARPVLPRSLIASIDYAF